MKFCSSCGCKIPTGALFCGECGFKLATEEKKKVPSPQPQGKGVTKRVARSNSLGNDLTASFIIEQTTNPSRDDQNTEQKFSSPSPIAKDLPSSPNVSSNQFLKKSNKKSFGLKPVSSKPERPTSPPPQTAWKAPTPTPATPSPTSPTSPASPTPEKRGRGDAKREEEFIQQGGARDQIESYINRRQQSSYLSRTVDPVTCVCKIHVTSSEVKMKNNKPDYVVYRVDVTYDNVSWTAFRRWGQWMSLESAFLRDIKGYTRADGLPSLAKPKGKEGKFSPDYINQRKAGLERFCQIMCSSRAAIFASKSASNAFFRFISPTQFGDIKPPHFVLPFKIDV